MRTLRCIIVILCGIEFATKVFATSRWNRIRRRELHVNKMDDNRLAKIVKDAKSKHS